MRVRLTLLATGLAGSVAAVLLWLGRSLAGSVVSAVPRLPAGSLVDVGGVTVPAEQLARVLADNARDTVLRYGVIALVLVVLAAVILAWTLTGRLLRPLRDVTATARKLSAESLGERIRLGGARDEVTELADTFDAMLDRLQSTFDAQHRFVANASHELRTPLAVMRTELEVTLADPGADVTEFRRMSGVLSGALERASQLVEALLLLARTDGIGTSNSVEVDLERSVRSAFAAVRDEAAERGIHCTFDTCPAVLSGDPVLLDRVAGNLVENAVRHNLPGGWITVRTEEYDGEVHLGISSSGPQLSAELIDGLFEPFRRAGVDRTAHQGAGLGLSIVRAVVAAHGGTVRAVSVGGGGLAVEVVLPTSR
ncbi:MAG: sensor histidine kinase [Sciscionella sp.]